MSIVNFTRINDAVENLFRLFTFIYDQSASTIVYAEALRPK